MAPALQGLVSGVIGQVIVLILLKEVGSMHLVATLHQSLQKQRGSSGRSPHSALGLHCGSNCLERKVTDPNVIVPYGRRKQQELNRKNYWARLKASIIG